MKTQTIDTTALTFTDITLMGLSVVQDLAFLIDVLSSPLIDSIHVERNGSEALADSYHLSVQPVDVIGWSEERLTADVATLLYLTDSIGTIANRRKTI